MVNSLDYYSYMLIGKLTAFLQLQEFSLCKLTVDFCRATFSDTLKTKVGSTLTEFELYVLHSILIGSLSLQENVLTHHTRKHLVY
jgi:hypothetical protein